MSQLTAYLRTRFTFYPWFILPLIFILISGLNTWHWLSLYATHLVGLLFFRIWDDEMCSDFDQKKKGKSYRLPRFKLFFSLLALSWSSLLLASGGIVTLAAGITLVFISSVFYKIVRGKNIEYISMLKYPVLICCPYIITEVSLSLALKSLVFTFLIFLNDYIQNNKRPINEYNV